MLTSRFSRVLILAVFVLLLGAGASLARADEYIEAACTHYIVAVTPPTALTYVCVDHANQLVGIGTSSPVARLHVDRAISVTDNAAERVTFSNAVGSINAYGLHVSSTPLANKGQQIGVHTETAIQPVGHPQDGRALGYLSISTGWSARGTMIGTQGVSRPRNLSNFDNSFTSFGLGGNFIGGPDPNMVLSLNSTGTYWVGGVGGQVEGRIDNTPARGAVAAIIGVDKNVGTAQSYAGYFEGDVRLEQGYLQLETVVGAPPAADCASQYVGRMVFEPGANLLWICDGSTWISK